MDPGGWPEGVEAGHSEAWASELADLVRHLFGETEDAPEELLRTVQEPGEEASRPRLQGESSEAPRELVFQRGEHGGSSELGGDDSSWTRHHEDLHRDEDCDAEKVEVEQPRPRWASSEAPREQVLQGGEREGSPGSCRRAQRQVDLSRRAAQRCPGRGGCPQAVNERARPRGGQPSVRVARQGCASSSVGGKRPARLPRGCRAGLRRTQHRLRPRKARTEMKETRAISGTRIATEQGGRVLPTEGATGPKGGIQVDCSWEHRRRSSALRVLGSSRFNFVSRESLTASQKIGEREIEGESERRGENRGREQVVACLSRD